MTGAQPQRRFQLVAALTGLVLLLLTVAGAATGAVRAPQLRDTGIQPERVVELAGQRLTLTFNQPLSAAPTNLAIASETHSPEFDVSASGAQITVTFHEPLLAAQEYRVTGDATSLATGASGVFSTSFKTAAQRLVTRVGDGPGSRIVAYEVPGGKPKEVLTADGIYDYAVGGNWVAAARERATGDFVLTVKQQDSSEQVELPIFKSERDHQIQFSPDGTLLGMKYDLVSHDVLALQSLANISTFGGRVVQLDEVTQLKVADWYFEQNSNTAHVLTQSGDHYTVGLDGVPQLTDDPWIPLADRSKPQWNGSELHIESERTVVNAQGEIIYQPAAPSSKVSRICLSPNKQFVAVEVVPADSGEASATPQQAVIARSTGALLATLPGTAASWCG
ncbi:Ig-like domain-containing protein [Canibacter zhoujuaniae]|uniref:Ig-like domain-containing protein n=1 Tax=Canibacter zhoujuaniae TaxID=2708343 RepID=UPI00141E49E5|nr:Ig-like domain-containing protein [Canibacter zhoujuaniae]